MAENEQATSALTALQRQRAIQEAITHLFAPEDEGLRHALSAAKTGGLPEIQISPLEGKLLQFLAVTCNARKILEIGSLAGYSGIWLARALPPDGKLITLEINPHHADIVRQSFAWAGVNERAEVRVGNALDLLPTLQDEAPFDLIFIDADKAPYPSYLQWALRLSRPGSIIVADNCVRGGEGLRPPEQLQDEGNIGIATFNQQVASNPRLLSLALVIDDGFMDGFTIAVVRPDTDDSK
jgi:caffeoyl-CoA O-methyltransferase